MVIPISIDEMVVSSPSIVVGVVRKIEHVNNDWAVVLLPMRGFIAFVAVTVLVCVGLSVTRWRPVT